MLEFVWWWVGCNCSYKVIPIEQNIAICHNLWEHNEILQVALQNNISNANGRIFHGMSIEIKMCLAKHNTQYRKIKPTIIYILHRCHLLKASKHLCRDYNYYNVKLSEPNLPDIWNQIRQAICYRSLKTEYCSAHRRVSSPKKGYLKFSKFCFKITCASLTGTIWQKEGDTLSSLHLYIVI